MDFGTAAFGAHIGSDLDALPRVVGLKTAA
jgi:hypothetical protein